MLRLENEDLWTPIHLYELWFSTIEEDVFVDAEPESVNSPTFHFDPETWKCGKKFDKASYCANDWHFVVHGL